MRVEERVVDRRDLLVAGAAAAAVALWPRQAVASVAKSKPPIGAIAFNRLAFGPRPGDVDRLQSEGLKSWVHRQLEPGADPEVDRRLAEAKLWIEYGDEKKDEQVVFPGVKEDRPLACLNHSVEELWWRTKWDTPVPWAERQRPFDELKVATLIRALYSEWQLREVLVNFWHDHFHVNGNVDDVRARVCMVVYDRDVIRKHALGNFREMLEAVATSVPMLTYLNNFTSRASPANENYARELFELHTLGAPNYLNHLYDQWREVPGADKGKPEGYIDQDVYEAARAFTGWTFEGGQWGRDEQIPNTGKFRYYDGYHDHYQKRVLGVEFPPNQPPMADGRKVLDLVAGHPGTAEYVCGKLVRRLVSDQPPAGLVAKAAKVFRENAKAPDQLAKVVETIALSPEFAEQWGTKVKRPFDSVVGMFRMAEAEVKPNGGMLWGMMMMGHDLFNWPTPDGFPDDAEYWGGSGGLLSRWNAAVWMTAPWCDFAKLPEPLPHPGGVPTLDQLADWHIVRMLGHSGSPETRKVLYDYFVGSSNGTRLEPTDPELARRTRGLIALVAMTPDFLYR